MYTGRANVKLGKSLNQDDRGHEEEQICRRTDNWLSEAGRGRYSNQVSLPPRQTRTGGRTRQLGISKRDDPYVRVCLRIAPERSRPEDSAAAR